MATDAAERYEQLKLDRDGPLRRARQCAELTLPALMPPENQTEGQDLPIPAQGFGARAVNNLASKLLLTLMPPNQPFYKLTPTPKIKRELEQRGDDSLTQVNAALSRIEQSMLTAIEGSADRVTTYEAIRHLVVCGNALIWMPNEGGMKMYRIDQYVIQRDPMGHLLEAVIHERVAKETLDEDTRQACLSDGEENDDADGNADVDVYTHIELDHDEGEWKVQQEINGVKVPGSEGTYPEDKPGFIALRWSAVSDEDYGRSLVYEHIGDLRSLEGLTDAVNAFAGNAAKILWLVNPNGQTNPKKLNRAKSGEFVPGDVNDIAALTMEKYPDFQMVTSRIQSIESRLQQAFLLTASVQRDAERVTATEINLMARELEDALGGVYSVLSQEFQVPYVVRKLEQLQNDDTIESLPDKAVEPQITTGLEALGRGHDLSKLNGLLSDIGQLPPQVAAQMIQRFNVDNLLNRLTTAHGINTEGLIKSQQQVQQETQQGMAQQVMQDAAPGVAQEAVKAAAAQNTPPSQ